MVRRPSIKALQSLHDNPTLKALQSLADSPSMKMMRDMADSPSMKALQSLADSPSMKALQSLPNSPTMKALQSLADSPAMKMMRDMADSPSIRAIEKITAQHQNFVKGLSLTVNLYGVAEVAGRMQSQPTLALAVATKVDAFQTAINEIDSAENYDRAAIETHFEELVDALLDLLGQTVGKIEFRSVVAFIWSIIPIVLAIYLYQLSSIQIEKMGEDNHLDHTEITDGISDHDTEVRERDFLKMDRLQELENKIDELSESKNAFEGTFYIVIRPVPLNIDQQYNGGRISWLFTGQEVELIERSGKWIRVISYDFETGTTEVGWVMKKYLRRIQ